MTERVAILGAGLIGRAWAVGFARGGCEVALWDAVPGAVNAALAWVPGAVAELEGAGFLSDPAEAVVGRITVAETLEGALEGAAHVQENIAEDREVKRAFLARVDAAAAPETVIASSTSALMPSIIFEGLAGAARCLVAHPINPPHLVPAVELVPGPQTSDATMDRTDALMRRIGQAPVRLASEVDGFVVNRLQGALLDEAFRLVAAGHARAEDIDVSIRDGLALRWSFMGPFETIDLNAPGGIADYIARYGPLYDRLNIGAEGRADWYGALSARLEEERRACLPLDHLPQRSRWRDEHLVALRAHKRRTGLEES